MPKSLLLRLHLEEQGSECNKTKPWWPPLYHLESKSPGSMYLGQDLSLSPLLRMVLSGLCLTTFPKGVSYSPVLLREHNLSFDWIKSPVTPGIEPYLPFAAFLVSLSNAADSSYTSIELLQIDPPNPLIALLKGLVFRPFPALFWRWPSWSILLLNVVPINTQRIKSRVSKR